MGNIKDEIACTLGGFDSRLAHMDLNTRLSDLTRGELIAVLEKMREVTNGATRTVSGLQGLAELFGVSLSTAKRLKASGILDRAISQRGHVIVTDAEMALRLYREATHSTRRKLN